MEKPLDPVPVYDADSDPTQTSGVEIVETDLDIDPWLQQPGEGEKPFQAFQMYRDLGYARSQAEVGRQLGKTKDIISRWSSEWGWIARARAWDQHLDRIRIAAQEEAVKATVEQHTRILAAARTKLAQRLVGDEAANVSALDPNRITWPEWRQMLDTVIKGERLTLGIATTVVDTHHSGRFSQDVTVIDPQDRIETEPDRIAKLIEIAHTQGLFEQLAELDAEEDASADGSVGEGSAYEPH